MTLRQILCLAAIASTFAACGSKSVSTKTKTPVPDDGLLHMISGSTLANFSYVITDPAVRRKLTDQGLNFIVQMNEGVHTFPIGASPYDQVTLLNAPRGFGDLDGDRYQDAVVALQIGHGDLSVTELEMVAIRNGKPTQVASYSLGHTKLNAITIDKRKMKANVTGTFPGDPGPRNTEYTFELPKEAMAGSGAVRE